MLYMSATSDIHSVLALTPTPEKNTLYLLDATPLFLLALFICSYLKDAKNSGGGSL